MPKGKIRFFGISLIVLLLLGGGFVVFQQQMGGSGDAVASADSTAVEDQDAEPTEDEEEEEIKVPVELATASPRDIPAHFQATGSLEARRNVELVSKASGQVTKLNFEEGDFIKQGQVLLELDPREEKIKLEQARVTLASAQRELARITRLTGQELSSEKDLDGAQKAADLAVHERDLAQVRLDDKIIRAPFEGQVAERTVELGQTVNAGASMLKLADVTPLEVRLFLPEQIVRDLSVGQHVEIRPDISPDRALAGNVHMIAPVVDPATSTVKVTLRVEDELQLARVGSFVRARITTDVHRDVVSVPKKALVPEAGATYVFVADADSVHKVPVLTGFSDDDFIEIIEGVTEGQQVVEIGQGGLRDGSKIRDLQAERAAAESEESSDAADQTDDTVAANGTR